jgi:hypothetical protein
VRANRRLSPGIAVLPAVLLVAACGSSGSSGTATVSSQGKSRATTTASGATGPTQPAKRAASAPSRPLGPRIGTTQRVRAEGTTLSITITRVIDPLRDSGATLLPGTRAVGVFVRIVNRGPGGYDSSSTGDVSIVPSSGDESPAYAPRGACQTPLQDFDNEIGPGENREGCVAFTLDSGARLAGERFSADGGGSGVATWRGPVR